MSADAIRQFSASGAGTFAVNEGPGLLTMAQFRAALNTLGTPGIRTIPAHPRSWAARMADPASKLARKHRRREARRRLRHNGRAWV